MFFHKQSILHANIGLSCLMRVRYNDLTLIGIDLLYPVNAQHRNNIGITHGFSCINICRVPWKLFEHEAARPSVQISSEGPGKCYCDEITMGDRCSCITYDSNGKL